MAWRAGSIATAAVVCLGIALSAPGRAEHAPASRVGPPQSLSAALHEAPPPAIEVGDGDAVTVSPVAGWRPIARASRPLQAEAPAGGIDAPLAWTPREAWRAPGHLRVGGDGGDAGG